MRSKNTLRWPLLLMVITILGITGFQVYWLRQTYNREQQTTAIKVQAIFRETLMRLQVGKLKLSLPGKDSSKQVRIMMKNGEKISFDEVQKEEIISSIDVIRGKLQDSMRVVMEKKPGIIISLNTTRSTGGPDSGRLQTVETNLRGPEDHMFNVLYGVDSLQQPLRLGEIDSAFTLELKKEGLSIPYTITEREGLRKREVPSLNEVTVGLSKPITYRLTMGNAFSYLVKQIAQPILFSVLLLGITVFSFVLLYRSLLRQQRLAALKNEFISNITHELKTPIATVVVAIEALKNFNAIDNPARTREYLDISQNELQRLSLLVDKVLKLSMFEKKEVELKYEPVDINEIVNEVVSSLRLQLEKKNASITVKSNGNVTMQGDRLHLLSVVFNLVDNAIKYSKEEPVINITINDAGEMVELVIEDNGIGIPEEYKDKLFEKFFRVPHGDTHNAKGYGLGLSYVAQVVSKHHGFIKVDTENGKGSRFIISLPRNYTGKEANH